MFFDNRELALAHHMADISGEILRRYWRTPVSVDQKADFSPVTHADREAEEAMRSVLAANFPDHGIFGEEHGRTNENATKQWVIDPIDGTRSFIAGYPIFTTLIALMQQDKPLFGIIDQPINNERWQGLAGEQTTCNGKPVLVRDMRELANANLATTSMLHFTPKETEVFKALRTSCANFQQGGDAYAYAMLASGNLDIVIDAHMKPYDYCALIPVIEGAGGIITDWSGKPLSTQSNGSVLAAGTKELHEAVLSILNMSS
ncbi:MAG: histidinol-phosphatase [Alphaproteobacteria bacterium]